MCEEGIMDKFGIDEIYGIHNDPSTPLGYFKTCAGASMAAADDFSINIFGQGGHAAEPEGTKDSIIAGVGSSPLGIPKSAFSFPFFND